VSVAGPITRDRGHDVRWRALLTRALTGEGVSTHFQPVVDLETGTLVGYEALTRFPGYPVSDPEQWFVAAREQDRSPALESLTLRRALAAREHLPSGAFLAVNVGPELLDHPDLDRVWDEHPDLSGVVVELTEHARIDSYTSLEPALDRLRTAGAMIAIDDVGAGYAGLQHLVGLRPQIIKLDRNVIAGIDRDETKRALVELIGMFASRIDAAVLAEGIEHVGELQTVMSLGVELAQGYLLGRPAPPWGELDRRGAALLATGLRRLDHGLHPLVEHAATAYDERTAASTLAHDPGDLVVLVDAEHRPLATMGVDGDVCSALGPSMRIRVDTSVTEAAERALTRSTDRRFHPLVCVDELGRYVGVVRMERVLSYLSAHARGSTAVLSHDSGAAGTVDA
jgi:EAL domain-containing protein (putative c-di-GMP-specific phosphodiesterase class I)